MEKNWKRIYSNPHFFKAEMVKQVFEDHDIQSVIINKQDSSYRFGYIEVYIHEQDSKEATALLAELGENNAL